MARGVSASKEDVHNAIQNIDKGLYPKAFCKIIPDILSGDPEWCNIMHADGAGTKSSLAYMYWKETGDLSLWKGIAQDALIMNIDDLLCVGAVDNILLSSTIGRNKNKIPGEVIAAIINGTDELCAELRSMGVNVYPTGGETADVGDVVRTLAEAFAQVQRDHETLVLVVEGESVVGLLTPENVVEFHLVRAALAPRRTDRDTPPPPFASPRNLPPVLHRFATPATGGTR